MAGAAGTSAAGDGRPAPAVAPPVRRPLGPAIPVILALALGSLVVAGPSAAFNDPPVPLVSTAGSPPPCRVADVTTTFTAPADWSRTRLDWTLRVTSSYRPPGLVPVSRAGISGSGTVRAEVIPDLRAMAAAARAAGAPLAIQSAYRSYLTQAWTFRSWVARLGYSTALIGSARPGHSEHQLGVALDFKSYGGRVPWSFGGYDWALTKAGRWMMQNAWKYGFVLSYPRGRRSEVCYGYEPWHYRYYGRTIARAIHVAGLTTRVWLWRHRTGPMPSPSPTPTPTPGDTPGPTDPTPTPTPGDTPGPTDPAPPSATPTAPAEPTSPAPTPTPGDTAGPTDSAPPTPEARPPA